MPCGKHSEGASSWLNSLPARTINTKRIALGMKQRLAIVSGIVEWSNRSDSGRATNGLDPMGIAKFVTSSRKIAAMENNHPGQSPARWSTKVCTHLILQRGNLIHGSGWWSGGRGTETVEVKCRGWQPERNPDGVFRYVYDYKRKRLLSQPCVTDSTSKDLNRFCLTEMVLPILWRRRKVSSNSFLISFPVTRKIIRQPHLLKIELKKMKDYRTFWVVYDL